MKLHKTLRQRKPETCPLLASRGGGLLELAEDPVEVLWRYSRAGVADSDRHHPVGPGLFNIDPTAVRRELHGVRKEIHKHLLHFALVAVNQLEVRPEFGT